MLELELTETVLMDASRTNNDLLLRLRNAGLRIAIDDFGAGYSSLDYLRRFPVDRIKIAQNFISELTTAPSNAVIVKAAIGLARELDIDVVAEGVETAQQLALIKILGMPHGAGLLFLEAVAGRRDHSNPPRRSVPEESVRKIIDGGAEFDTDQ